MGQLSYLLHGKHRTQNNSVRKKNVRGNATLYDREIARLMRAMGANELSAYGLCHLGDYEATVFSKHSHNRAFGEAFIKQEPFDALAEGYYTVCALMRLTEQYDVELPICRAVYALLYENAKPKDILAELFDRKFRNEFY